MPKNSAIQVRDSSNELYTEPGKLYRESKLSLKEHRGGEGTVSNQGQALGRIRHSVLGIPTVKSRRSGNVGLVSRTS